MINKSENINQIPTVLAFGKIEGLGATNVIPSEVKLAGTFRTLNEEWRALAHSKIAEIVKHITTEMQGSYELNINRGYPCLVNDEQVTETCMQAASEIIGDANIIDLPHRMTAEDFAYFSQQKPVCFYRLGTGNEAAQSQHNVHTSDFNIDENVLKDSPAVMTAMTIQLLEQ
jgi:amidohydrolase